MILSYSKGVVFIANPKAASTSLELKMQALQEEPSLNERARHGLYTRRHITALDASAAVGSLWSDLWSFAILRNPLSWLASQVCYNASRIGLQIGTGKKIDVDRLECFLQAMRDRRGQQASQYITQWAFVCDSNRSSMVSCLLRLEQLHRYWPTLARRLGIVSDQLTHANRTAHPSAKELFTRRALEHAEQLWETDLILWEQADWRRAALHAVQDWNISCAEQRLAS